MVGTLTSVRIPGGGYLVIPAASVKAHLEWKPEREVVLGDPTTAIDTDTTRLGDPRPPPMPINAPKDTAGPDGSGRGGNHGTGSSAGTPGRPDTAPPPPPPASVVVKKARALNNPRPAYTEQARVNGTEGRVVVRITIGAAGLVTSATVSEGLPDGMNQKAIEAVYRLEFDPARNAAGEPVASNITVAIDFRISRKAGDVTGVWQAVRNPGQPTVQFHLERVSPTERRGFVIIGRGPGLYDCVPVVGSYEDGLFEATATVAAGSCTYRWSGRLREEVFDVEEVRTCGASGESVKRSIGIAKVE